MLQLDVQMMKDTKEDYLGLQLNQTITSNQNFSVFLLMNASETICYIKDTHNYNFMGSDPNINCGFLNEKERVFKNIKEFPPKG